MISNTSRRLGLYSFFARRLRGRLGFTSDANWHHELYQRCVLYQRQTRFPNPFACSQSLRTVRESSSLDLPLAFVLEEYSQLAYDPPCFVFDFPRTNETTVRKTFDCICGLVVEANIHTLETTLLDVLASIDCLAQQLEHVRSLWLNISAI